MDLRRVKIIGNLILFIGGCILMLALIFNNYTQIFLGILGIIVIFIGYLFFFLLWRCPYCHRPLPFHGLLGVHYCPY